MYSSIKDRGPKELRFYKTDYNTIPFDSHLFTGEICKVHKRPIGKII